MVGQECIITKGNCKGCIGRYMRTEEKDGKKMVVLEMDYMYEVEFPEDGVKICKKVLTVNKKV